MNKTLEEIKVERGIDGEGFKTTCYLAKSQGISDDEYSEICKAFGKAKDEEKKPDSETFKKERFITFVASDETVDSYGDILRVAGADLTRYNSGAAAFITSHNLSNISGACGVIVKAKKGKNEGSPNGKAVLVTVYFPTAEEDSDADYIFKKYKARTLNAVSVGFTPIEYNYPETDEERKKIGLGKYGVEFIKWAPYELSAVTVGANPSALMKREFNTSFEETKQEFIELKKQLLNLETMIKALVESNQNIPNNNKGKPVVSVREYLEAHPIKCEIK